MGQSNDRRRAQALNFDRIATCSAEEAWRHLSLLRWLWSRPVCSLGPPACIQSASSSSPRRIALPLLLRQMQGINCIKGQGGAATAAHCAIAPDRGSISLICVAVSWLPCCAVCGCRRDTQCADGAATQQHERGSTATQRDANGSRGSAHNTQASALHKRAA